MKTTNVLFLIDLNSLVKVLLSEDVSVSFENVATSEDFHPIEDIDEVFFSVRQIADFLLLELSKACRDSDGSFNTSKLSWGYKFYMSNMESTFPRIGRKFVPLDLYSIERFESDLREAVVVHANNFGASMRMEYLVSSVKELTADLPWPVAAGQNDSVRNLTYVLSRLPSCEADMIDLVGTDKGPSASTSYKEFIKCFIPREFYKKFHLQYEMCINFVNVSKASVILPVFHDVAQFFRHGKVIMLEHIKPVVSLEYPSYAGLIRTCLKQDSVSCNSVESLLPSKSIDGEERTRRGKLKTKPVRQVVMKKNVSIKNIIPNGQKETKWEEEREKFSKKLEYIVHQKSGSDVAKSREKVASYIAGIPLPQDRCCAEDSSSQFSTLSRGKAIVIEAKREKQLERTKEVVAALDHVRDIDTEEEWEDLRETNNRNSCATSNLFSSLGKLGERTKNHSFISAHNPRKHIFVAKSRKANMKEKSLHKHANHMTSEPSRKSPRRVRRNLFQVEGKNAKVSKEKRKASCSISRNNSGFHVSKSHQGSTGLSTLEISPTAIGPDQIICPETPSTPTNCYSVKRHRYDLSEEKISHISSKRKTIEESPIQGEEETHHAEGKEKSSRVWTKTRSRLVAARIKDTADLRSSLSASDFEMLSTEAISTIEGSPSLRKRMSSSNLSSPLISPRPCSSNSIIGTSIPTCDLAKNDISPSIESLILTGNYPPPNIVNEKFLQLYNSDDRARDSSATTPRETVAETMMPPPPPPVSTFTPTTPQKATTSSFDSLEFSSPNLNMGEAINKALLILEQSPSSQSPNKE